MEISIGEIWSDLDHRLISDSLGKLKLNTNVQSVMTSIDNILRTHFGERVMYPQFGFGMDSIMFESMSSDDMTSPAPFPTTAMFPSSSTNEKPLFSARSSSSDTSWNFLSSLCLNIALSSIMTLPSSASKVPSFSIATGFISASSASFSTVSFDNF